MRYRDNALRGCAVPATGSRFPARRRRRGRSATASTRRRQPFLAVDRHRDRIRAQRARQDEDADPHALPGLPGGEYQSVIKTPVSGSSEAIFMKLSASCAASHRIGLTSSPIRGPCRAPRGAWPAEHHPDIALGVEIGRPGARRGLRRGRRAGTFPSARSVPQPQVSNETLAASAGNRR